MGRDASTTMMKPTRKGSCGGGRGSSVGGGAAIRKVVLIYGDEAKKLAARHRIAVAFCEVTTSPVRRRYISGTSSLRGRPRYVSGTSPVHLRYVSATSLDTSRGRLWDVQGRPRPWDGPRTYLGISDSSSFGLAPRSSVAHRRGRSWWSEQAGHMQVGRAY
jgi:hypothetical protein